MGTPRRFLDLLATEINAAEQAASKHDRAGDPHLADWWRSRGEELRQYLEGTRLRQTELSPGLEPVRPRRTACPPQDS